MRAEIVAYLDPGSGSILLQVLVGGVAAVGLSAKLWWRGLKSRLGLGRGPAEGKDSTTS